MILVTGATGKVGSEAVRVLRQQDVPVRALVRDPQKAQTMAEAGAELVVGDFDDPTSLLAAMDGVSSVLLTSPGGEPVQELNVVDAAARAGVEHVVKLTSKASPDSPVARQRWHAQIEQGLAASGLAHTLMRSNAFMQNTLMVAPSIAKTSSFSSSIGTGRVGMSDARDVGAVAAALVADPTGHAGKTYWLSGPELLTYADVAAVLSRLLGRTVTFQPRSRSEDETEMVSAGLPQPVAAMNALALSLFADGDAEWLSPDMATLLGRPARSYEQFATDNLAAFS
jgi:uncharacterized protein YbjT (DUF2867 family)